MPQSKKSVTKSKPRQETDRVENQQPMGGGQTKEPFTYPVGTRRVPHGPSWGDDMIVDYPSKKQMEEKVNVKKSVKSMVKKAVTKVRNALNSDDKTIEQIPVEAVVEKEKSSMLDQMNFWSAKKQEQEATSVITEGSRDLVTYESFKKALDDHNDEVTKLRNTRVTHVINHLDSIIKPDIIEEITRIIKSEVVEQINDKLDKLIFYQEREVIALLKNNDGTTIELPTQDEGEALMWEAALHYAGEQTKEERLRMLSNLTIGQSPLQEVFMQIGDSMSEECGDSVESINGEAVIIEPVNTVSSIVSSIEKQSTSAEDAVHNCFGDMMYDYNNETSYVLVEDKKVFFKVNEDDLLLSFICKSTPKKCVKDIGELLVEFANGRVCTGCSYQSSPESDDWELLKRVSGRLNDHIENVTKIVRMT